jgi:hypothetical protein
MKQFATILFLVVLIFLLSLPVFAQDMGDNEFHFVASFNKLPEDDEMDMTNIKYVGDTDQDGKGEFCFLTTNGDSCYFILYEATGNDSYEQVFVFPFTPVWNSLFRDWTAIVAGDLNGNGVVEIIVGLPVDMTGFVNDHNPPRLVVFEWAGTVGENMYGFDNGTNPNAYWNFDVPDDFSIVPFQFTIDDVDNDGTMELIADMREPKAVYVISQTESWDFPFWRIEWYITNNTTDPKYVNHFDGGGFYGSSVGDLDSDGKKEIYVPVWDLLTLNIYECQEPGIFTREAYIRHVRPDTDFGAVRGVRVGDVNNDGMKELYYIGTDKDASGMGHIFGISNITDVSQVDSASFVDLIVYNTHPLNTLGRAARAGFLTDIDKDGNADLMICGSGNGQIYDFEYKGSGDPMDSNNWTHTIAFDLWEHWATYLPDSVIQLMSPRFWDGDVCDDMDGDDHNEFVVINYGTDRGVVPDDPWFYIFEEGAPTRVNPSKNISLPETFKIYQNYPNPFNHSTTIRYSVPENSFISIKVFDILGKEVKTLIESAVPAGQYSISWDGTDNNGRVVGSGSYFYQLKTADHTYTRSMSLVK